MKKLCNMDIILIIQNSWYLFLFIFPHLPIRICLIFSPKSSANSISVTPIWKREFAKGSCIGIFFEIFFSNFCSHIKDSKWGRKFIFMNFARHRGSLQQIPLRQLPFANEVKSQFPLQRILGSILKSEI